MPGKSFWSERIINQANAFINIISNLMLSFTSIVEKITPFKIFFSEVFIVGGRRSIYFIHECL